MAEPKLQTDAAAARQADLDHMKRTMVSMGITPKADPGAGLPPAEASMARELARHGLKPVR